MNNDLISREALKEAFEEAHTNFELTFDINTYGDVINIIDNAPTVEYPFYAEAYQTGYEEGKNERPQGEWIGDTDYGYTCKCSKCRKTFDTDRLKMVMLDGKYELPPCCPNCGADMRKGEEE